MRKTILTSKKNSMSNVKNLLGIDVGASGIKGAIVDIATGAVIGERFRVEMPDPSTPENAAKAINDIVKNFNYNGPIGLGFPSVIKNGIASTAANLDKKWIGCNVEDIISKETGCKVVALNDADAAGIAEMRFGVGNGKKGTVVLITIGTGLGSAVFTDGYLVRNTEFGHILLKNGMIAEHFASNSAQKREDLSWKKWAKRFDEYLHHIELYLQPSLIILGGGSSKYFDEYKHKFTIDTPIMPAKLLNNAGIIGAAVYAAEK
jgi:polyphosphate glucokinase